MSLRLYRSDVLPHRWFRVQSQSSGECYYAKLVYCSDWDPKYRVFLMDVGGISLTMYPVEAFLSEWFNQCMVASQSQWEISYEPDFMQVVLNETLQMIRS